MQSKGQFEQKVWEMIEPMPKELLTKCLELYDSGGINPDDFEDDFTLPRIVLRIATEREAEGIAPMHWIKGCLRLPTYRNLKHF